MAIIIAAGIQTAVRTPEQTPVRSEDNYSLVLTVDPHHSAGGPATHTELADHLRQTWGSWITATGIHTEPDGQPQLEIWIRQPAGADTPTAETVREDIHTQTANLGIPATQILIQETPYTLEEAADIAKQAAAAAIGELGTDIQVQLIIDPRGEIQQIASSHPDEIQARVQDTPYRQHIVQPLAADALTQLQPQQPPSIWQAYLRSDPEYKAVTLGILAVSLAIAAVSGWKWRISQRNQLRAWPWAAAAGIGTGTAILLIWSVYQDLLFTHIYG